MCGLWQKKPEIVDIKKAKSLIDFMADNKVAYVQITGGEPFLYPDLIDLIRYITKQGILIQLATNGTLIRKDNAKEARRAGLKHICISLDHFIPEVHDSIRRFKGTFAKAMESIKILKNEGYNIYTSSVINKHNHLELKKFVEFVNSLGIGFGVCFPYPKFNVQDKISCLDDDELIHAINALLKLKRDGYNIVNTNAYLIDCLRFVEGKPALYPCLAGTRVFGLKIDEFRTCWLRKDTVFTIEDGFKENEILCNTCVLACFRETSTITGLQMHNKKVLIKEILNYFKKPKCKI
jgi:MoaA/NifB/PqqE/SkfB family radical SAM enzyme